MAGTITLQLTHSGAVALNALVDRSAELLFGVVGGDKDFNLEGWTKEEAAHACDKLRTATLGEDLPEVLTWSAHLRQLIT